MPALSLRDHLQSPQFIYRYDALVGVLFGAVLILAAGPLAELAGWPPAATFLVPIGAFLLSWGLFNFAIGVGIPGRSAVITNLAGDGLWVLLSAVMLFVHGMNLNAIGYVLMIAQMTFVALVLLTKLRGAPALLALASR